MIRKGKLLCVVGGQYGSEGKGAVVAHIANEYDVHVRIGSPNAGHTFYWKDEKHVMQSIPCGWINPNARIVIGRGALINMKQLMVELDHIQQYYPDFKERLFIDANAGILDEKFHKQEGGVDGEMHKRIGSTGEGVGLARIARIERNTDNFRFFKDVAEEYGLETCITYDTHKAVAEWQDKGLHILVEGTQGSALSLLHGHYPYVTSIDTNASQMLAEIGIAPSRLTDVLLVFRTYPIRVAGNSGYMKDEITWEELSKRMGKKLEEKTTVTKKVRRIAEWDQDLFENSVLLNAPTQIALMFADYLDNELYGETDADELFANETFNKFVTEHIYKKGHSVAYIGTSERTIVTNDEEV